MTQNEHSGVGLGLDNGDGVTITMTIMITDCNTVAQLNESDLLVGLLSLYCQPHTRWPT